MLTSRPLLRGTGHAFEIKEIGGERLNDAAVVHDFWAKFTDLFPEAHGFSPMRDPEGAGIRILRIGGHFSAEEIAAMRSAADQAAEANGIQVIVTKEFPMDVRSFTNDWEAHPNGEQYLARLKEIGKPGIPRRIREHYEPEIRRLMLREYRKAIRGRGQ